LRCFPQVQRKQPEISAIADKRTVWVPEKGNHKGKPGHDMEPKSKAKIATHTHTHTYTHTFHLDFRFLCFVLFFLTEFRCVAQAGVDLEIFCQGLRLQHVPPYLVDLGF
jgi:hypothetical protein